MTTQMLELTEAQQELENAQRERAQLDERIAALEEQVRDGDQQDAIEELGRQWAARRLVELQQVAAEERVRAAEAAALEERRREAEAAAQADLEILSIARLAQALDTAVNALQELQRLGDARQAALDRHAKAFIELGMDGHIVHQDGGWVVFEAGGVKYDTAQDGCAGERLVALAGEELARRGQEVRRLAQGFDPFDPLPHPVTRHLASQQGTAA